MSASHDQRLIINTRITVRAAVEDYCSIMNLIKWQEEGILNIIGTQRNCDLTCCGCPALMFDTHAAILRLISLVHAFSAIRSTFGLMLDQQETEPWSEIAGFSILQNIHPSSRNYSSVRASKQALCLRLNTGDLLPLVNRAVGITLQHCRLYVDLLILLNNNCIRK